MRVHDLDASTVPEAHYILRDADYIYIAGSEEQYNAIRTTPQQNFRMYNADIVIERSTKKVVKIRY